MSDSKAAIGALLKGVVSERKRVRAAGRAWLNFGRPALIEKRDHIFIEHVRSHQGVDSPEQVGNDRADVIAKAFLNKGSKLPPALYLTHSEETFILCHKGNYIQGDIRNFMKSIAKQKMIERWKIKAPRQSEFFLAFPHQVQSQAQDVWRRAAEKGEGNAWLYFIFGTCQMLPTQHRINKHIKDPHARSCLLCLGGAIDNMAHLWVCPAMAGAQSELQMKVDSILQQYFPFASYKLESRQSRLRRQWYIHAKKDLARSIPDNRLVILTQDFWNKNKHKEFIPLNSFYHELLLAIERERNHPNLRWSVRSSFLSILVEEFHLNVEGFATPLSHSNEFQYWCSESAADQEFGALGSFFSYDLSGKNTFGFIQEDDPASAGAVITRTEKFIEASCSSRVLLLLPSTIHHKFITIAHLSGCPLFLNHQDVSNFSLVLAVNKESILTDPINCRLGSRTAERVVSSCSDSRNYRR